MKVHVLYFAAIRDLIELDEESVDLPQETRTVGDFLAWLEAHHPRLQGRMDAVRIARNEAFARAGEVLTEGDTLAALPPLAGG